SVGGAQQPNRPTGCRGDPIAGRPGDGQRVYRADGVTRPGACSDDGKERDPITAAGSHRLPTVCENNGDDATIDGFGRQPGAVGSGDDSHVIGGISDCDHRRPGGRYLDRRGSGLAFIAGDLDAKVVQGDETIPYAADRVAQGGYSEVDEAAAGAAHDAT